MLMPQALSPPDAETLRLVIAMARASAERLGTMDYVEDAARRAANAALESVIAYLDGITTLLQN